MDGPSWVLIWYVVGIAIIASILWILGLKMRADYHDDDEEGQPQPNAAASQVRVIVRSQPPKAKLHEKLKRMIYDVYTHESSSDGGCAICLDEYRDGERRATIAACRHRFHALCVEAWLRKNNSCPLCRHNLV